ncbi:MAG: hypothetical protein LBL66_09955 [Clostridiales bacterium]|jgi:uroporphyrinogen-III decarboxylase|nr:hypothetical protein [Clostridiales bacterium]
MTGRERFLTAFSNKKPDRLPCQVHSWMAYYLNTYLKGMDQYAAYDYFGMDPMIYVGPIYKYDKADEKNWVVKGTDYGLDKDGYRVAGYEYATPEGVLTERFASNQYTTWETELLVKDKRDMELFLKYYPLPAAADWTPVRGAKERVGDRGLVRGHNYNYGQPGAWQSYTCLVGTENAILSAIDEPEYVHWVLDAITAKCVKSIGRIGKFEFDVVENGGGAASSTVISPSMHKEFCLPYDRRVHAALKEAGSKVVYHLCGGLMPLLETVAENGADALETMTPPAMGGDCDLKEAARRVGNKLAFVGGFDQNAGFEKGTAENIRAQVRALFRAKPDGGYICSPSDHFFFGDPENIRIFTDECKKCIY